MTLESTAGLADRVARQLAHYRFYIETKAKAGLLDIAVFGEPLARDLTKIVFGYNDMVSLNIHKSFTAIDLASEASSCAVQVTLKVDLPKIVETQQTFFAHGLHKKYSRLMFIALKMKQASFNSDRIVREYEGFTFEPSRDVFDLNDLYRIVIHQCPRERVEAFGLRLAEEVDVLLERIAPLAPRVVQPSPEVTHPAVHLRKLFNAHGVLPTDAIEGLKSFGVTREVYADDVKLANAAGRSLIDHVANEFSVSNSWIDGTDDHIYSGGTGAEHSTSWRRSLRGAYEFINSLISDGQKLTLFVPHEIALHELDETEDVIDRREPGYTSFFLVAKRMNSFLTERYRVVISDPLSYRPSREGLFLLFLATELRRLLTQEQFLIDVWQTSSELIAACNSGKHFIVDLERIGGPFRNHADFVFYDQSRRCLTASQDVPTRLATRLQQELDEFVKGQSAHLPNTIRTSQC